MVYGEVAILPYSRRRAVKKTLRRSYVEYYGVLSCDDTVIHTAYQLVVSTFLLLWSYSLIVMRLDNCALGHGLHVGSPT